MKRKKLWSFGRNGIAGTLAMVLAFGGIVPVNLVKAEEAYGSIEVDPYTKYQTLEGWGTSLCWWGNSIGSWGDNDYNKNGIPDREEIAKLAFSPEYLNLNIARYNVGGGDAPGHWDPTSSSYHLYREESRVPGWTTDMGFKEDGSGTYNEGAFMGKAAEKMNDAGQIWMLEQANAYRKSQKDIVNEVFSNSPPYYMTKSNCSSGNQVSSKDNLKEDCYDSFATYMARATKWISNDLKKKYGSDVSYVEPMNEPDSDYWGANSSKQEGCHFSAGESQSTMLMKQKKALKEQGLTGVKLTATDETSLGSAISSFNKLSKDAKAEVETISAHTYGGSDSERTVLRDLAASYDKGLWMSEVCRGGGKHSEASHNSVVQTHAGDLSNGILKDLKNMQSTAWIEWLVADSEYECIQTNSNWGLLHTVFETNGPEPKYHKKLFNSDGTVKAEVPKAGTWYITKQFYTLMQYSKFLKVGYTMIQIGDDNMIGAVSPDGKELVIVAQNMNDSKRKVSLDLSELKNVKQVKTYRTSEKDTGKVQNPSTKDMTECCSEVGDTSWNASTLTSELPENSLSTFVISGNQSMFDLNKSSKTINDQVYAEDGNGNTVSLNKDNKFSYAGNGWAKKEEASAYGNGVYESKKSGSKAEFTFTGERAMIVGNKGTNGAEYTVTVDGVGVPGSFTAKSKDNVSNQILYDTGKLKAGKHTVILTKDSSANTVLSIDCAKIITGDLQALKAPMIQRIQAYDKALKVTFRTVTEARSYVLRYGTNKDKLDQEVQVSGSPAVLSGLENGRQYYLQVIAQGVDGSEAKSEVYSKTPESPSETVLYNVDIAQKNLETPVDGTLGRYNSVLDQRFSKDAVTGKSWGYVENTSGGTWDDTDKWWSVRYSSSKAVGSNMDYQFEVDPGEYWVTVGSFDPWGNGTGRKQVITANGQPVSDVYTPLHKENTHQFKVAVTEHNQGQLTIGAKVAEGGDDNSLLSFIVIESYNGDAIASIQEAKAAALEDSNKTNLPNKVTVTKRDGTVSEADVSWELPDTFHTDLPYGTVKVFGSVQGTNEKAVAHVQVIPKDLEYFIDCGIKESNTETFMNVNAQSTKLENVVPDQKKVENTTWGYTGEVGTDIERYGDVDAGNPYETGWWAHGDKDISYQLTLSPGKHKVSMGFTGWWSMDRKMNVMYRVGESGEEKELFSVTAPKNASIAPSGEIEITGANSQVVTLTVKKAEKDDPILSFISVSRILPKIVAVSDVCGVPTEMVEGSTLQLTATVMPENATNKEITWSVRSAEETGAYLAGNELHADRQGNVVVTATVNGGTEAGAYTKDFSIKVTAKPVIPTPTPKPSLKKQHITVNKWITTEVGAKSFKLKAKSDGDGKLSYSVDNKKVVKVDKNGRVTVKRVGKATITITASQTARYKAATKKVHITVNPKGTSIKSLQNRFWRTLSVKWKRNRECTGYVIQYGKNSKGKSAKTITIKNNRTVNKMVYGLTRGKKYYVRIRTYTKVNGKKYYSAWSKSKAVKVKR